ncbi:MAG: 1,4-alpha-glucan branching protein GlgB [Anaerolineaceae bacterium]|nr:MAG: 1,4-alpha-glucan branching protein GlgB [Anaerolineaceae bacterium]
MPNELHPDGINALVYGDHGAPRDILGLHRVDEGYVARVFYPYARAAYLLADGERTAMTSLHDHGLFEAPLAGVPASPHRYEIVTPAGDTITIHDPYTFPLTFSDYDLYLWNEGRLLDSYRKFGAQLRDVGGVRGVNFAVWAPNAQKVAVIGDFNGWDARVHPMHRHGDSGVWELFIPGLAAGAKYKFEIRSQYNRYQAEKFDPFAFGSELRPSTASVVEDLTTYEWQDAGWMKTRGQGDPLQKPMAIYEVHLGSWRRDADNAWLTYRQLADELVDYVKEMGYTHVELLPVAEHPFDGSWGYQVTGYYAPTRRFGSPDDFKYFVDTCHQNGIGVILDWVPAHFPKDGFSLSFFDGTHLYEHDDPRLGEHPDWGTYIFNYGRNEVRNFLISNALFWLREYHIDGLRVDAVSSMLYLDFGREDGQWIPNEHGGNENLPAVDFIKQANEVIHSEFPGAITIAEESTAWAMVSRPTYIGGLGFTFKWNMGWMHDTLKYISLDPVHRRYHHNNLTFSMMYAFTENFVLSLSHDEVVHGKGSLMNKAPGDWWQKFATLRLLSGYQYTHPGKKLNFMGHEFGQWREWSEMQGLDWHLLDYETHQAAQDWHRDLNHFYQAQPALYEQDYTTDGFQWIEANDNAQSVFSYMRFAEDRDDFLVVVCNFTPIPRYDYRVGVPQEGYYKELLNSDSEIYGGSNMGNAGGCWTSPHGWQMLPYSLTLTIPPLSVMILKWQKP